jgi:CRP-like cAMP-binding protein
MHLAELTVRLAATTLFAPVDRAQLRALLGRSARHQAHPGDWLADLPHGLRHHLVLLAGAVETQRCWSGPGGAECGSVRRVGVDAAGPGFALLGAGGSGLRVRAVADTEYLAIDTDDLDDLLGWSVLGAFVLPEPHLKLFHRLPLETVAQAIDHLVERTVSAGETIVRQGDPGDNYYVIVDGEAEVWVADAASGALRLINTLADGDSFGEEALLAGGSRNATVRMSTPGRLLALAKADFDALLRPPMVEEIAAPAAREMLMHGAAKLLDCRHAAEHAASRIAGARSLPLGSLRQDGVFAIDPDATYIVYCDTGRRSRAAAFLLYERGIRALSLTGGLSAWPYELEGTQV